MVLFQLSWAQIRLATCIWQEQWYPADLSYDYPTIYFKQLHCLCPQNGQENISWLKMFFCCHGPILREWPFFAIVLLWLLCLAKNLILYEAFVTLTAQMRIVDMVIWKKLLYRCWGIKKKSFLKPWSLKNSVARWNFTVNFQVYLY